MLSEGTVLQQNRYRITRILGQGGMGAVYEAWHNGLEIPVALKEMIPQPNLNQDMLAQLRSQFKREANTLARLSHSHLVHVMDSFEEGGNAYLVMEMVPGENLADRIRERGVLPEAIVMQWAHQLLDALAYCHGQGIIHRDIKPHNVVIRSDERAVLVDFGLVKLWDPRDPHTKTVMRGMGTPEYAPPEQYDAEVGHTDARSDIYSLGATLYHALAGKAPPTATTRIVNPDALIPVRALDPSIHPQVEQVLIRAMELRPIDRYQNAREMSAALRVTAARNAQARRAASVQDQQPQRLPPQRIPPAQQVTTVPPSHTRAETVVLSDAPPSGPTSLPPMPAQPERKRGWMSIVSPLLGLMGLVAVFIAPWCNILFAPGGIILGILGARAKQRRILAILGILICILVLALEALDIAYYLYVELVDPYYS